MHSVPGQGISLPSDARIRRLHEKYAPTGEAFEVVYSHCEIVWRIAEQLLRPGMDAELVRAGSLLHDIGVYRLYSDGVLDHANYVRHGVLGHAVLAAEGFPEEIRRFCSCHTGVGLTREDARELGLPVADYLAESAEERLVMYADKFHTKTDPPKFLNADAYAVFLSRFGEDKVAAFKEMREAFGEPDLPVSGRVRRSPPGAGR
jgi:uncharacterized protein